MCCVVLEAQLLGVHLVLRGSISGQFCPPIMQVSCGNGGGGMTKGFSRGLSSAWTIDENLYERGNGSETILRNQVALNIFVALQHE